MLQMMANGNNNGLTNGNNSNALSPTTPTVAPTAGVENWQAADDDIAMVSRRLQEADQRINSLSNRLSPLSPEGIPGFNDNGYIPPPGNDGLDFDQIFNTGDYFSDTNNGPIDFGTDATDFDNGNFTFDDPLGTNSGNPYNSIERDDQGGRVVETVDSSEATSPANTVEDSVLDDAQSPRKRARRS